MGVAAPKNLKVLAESAQKVCGRSWRATKWGSRLTRGGSVAIGEHVLRVHDVSRAGTTWTIGCRFGKIQPHDTIKLANNLYAASTVNGPFPLEGKIYADNISRPVAVRLALNFTEESRAVSLDEIERLEFERFAATPEGKRLLAEAQEDNEE